ncbi:hypothetical protein [Microbacterium capsulatum]|uniref:Uncharacterized protein n=1 Tax=Microbacterium capsulatum TaxID=3041921 RepID=A0ABU0XMJ5_9MICO|nr:hypothetical protein [Microbacterium sp. ASV81]MDQ4215839.1 hypothetical protein [Microbacterium sp. ASV81]
MDIVVNTVNKYWLGLQRASTQLISIPRSRVLGEAALTAVWGSPAWVRIADARGSAWLTEAPFGGQTVLRATTDLVVLQVWADQDVKAAAVGTLFLSSPYLAQIDGREVLTQASAAHAVGLHPVEETTWVGYAPDGEVSGAHSVVRYDGAAPLGDEEIRRLLTATSDAPEETEFTPVDTTGLLATRRIRIDTRTRRLLAD